jgi:hypothetical protein
MSPQMFELDPAGFPMMWVQEIEAYVHWMPVTKIQFEYFVCAAPDSRFDARWYEEALDLNPRTTATDLRSGNYWNAFLTGITPSEAQRFASWCGGSSIPSLDEWFSAYRALKAKPPLSNLDAAMESLGLRDRTRSLLRRLESVGSSVTKEYGGYERTLADQMLMRLGVMEWVECSSRRSPWGGMGQTHTAFHGSLQTPDHGQPMIPIDPEANRLGYFGLRLVRRLE